MIRSSRLLVLALCLPVLTGMSRAVAGSPRPFHSRVVAVWDNVFAALTPQGANFTGIGQTTHMGRGAQAGTLFLFPEFGNPLIPGIGAVTITAANGDSVSFDYVGTLNPFTGEGIGTFLFTGGTGRFAGATGSGTFHALIDASVPVNQPMTVVLDGQIIY